MSCHRVLLAGLCWVLAAHAAQMEARLLTPISSYTTKAGTPIEALVTTRVCAEDGVAVRDAVVIRGTVRKVHRVGLGIVHETAGMQLEFHELHLPDGRDYPLIARLDRIENARERVDRDGMVHGIRATATLSNRVGERLFFLAVHQEPEALVPLFMVETAAFHFPEPEIEYNRGAEFRLEVDFPDSSGAVGPCATAAPEAPSAVQTELRRVVDDLPYWTYSVRQRQPLDLVNLVYVGSEDALRRAFAAAGWVGSKANSMRAGFAAIRAIAQNSSDSDAPMRVLLLNGQPPDISLQKSLNTFEKRDHLRIWKRPDGTAGQTVWASSATRDLAAVFSTRPFGFTHEIQNDVDKERDKVVRDLISTGCVNSVSYLRRQAGVRAPGQDYRRGVSTDERVAVVMLNGCDQTPAVDFGAASPMAGPGQVVRAIRRVTLTARNHMLRDNWIWRSGDALRLCIRSVRGWQEQRRDERRAAAYYAREKWRTEPSQQDSSGAQSSAPRPKAAPDPAVAQPPSPQGGR